MVSMNDLEDRKRRARGPNANIVNLEDSDTDNRGDLLSLYPIVQCIGKPRAINSSSSIVSELHPGQHRDETARLMSRDHTKMG